LALGGKVESVLKDGRSAPDPTAVVGLHLSQVQDDSQGERFQAGEHFQVGNEDRDPAAGPQTATEELIIVILAV
jgi:hypothetical protein